MEIKQTIYKDCVFIQVKDETTKSATSSSSIWSKVKEEAKKDAIVGVITLISTTITTMSFSSNARACDINGNLKENYKIEVKNIKILSDNKNDFHPNFIIFQQTNNYYKYK